jgi:electron transfer flavoprotein beta subunit
VSSANKLFFFFALGFALVYVWSPAVEEAVRLRERLKDKVKSITVVTLGPSKAAETLRTALAMGADDGIHIELPESAPAPEPLGVARALRAVIERRRTSGGAEGSGMETDLVIMGKQAIDDDLGQTGQMLAGLLGAAQATCASKLEVDVDARVARVRTEIDGGAAELLCTLPAVVTTDLRCVVRCARDSEDLYTDFFFVVFRLNGTVITAFISKNSLMGIIN